MGIPQSRIDKNGALPLHYQLETIVRERIGDHVWNLGMKIPAELDLCKEFGLSRNTVRQALLNLVGQGILYREQGHGTYVSRAPFDYPTDRLMSFNEEMTGRGIVTRATILIAEKTSALPTVADNLGLPAGAEVYRLKRLRFADEKAICLQDAYLPATLFPGILDDFSSNDSLYGRMENVYGLTAAYATERIEASMPSTEETHSLQITKTTPVLRIQRRTFLKNGTPMESVESVYRCDTYCVILNLRRP